MPSQRSSPIAALVTCELLITRASPTSATLAVLRSRLINTLPDFTSVHRRGISAHLLQREGGSALSMINCNLPDVKHHFHIEHTSPGYLLAFVKQSFSQDHSSGLVQLNVQFVPLRTDCAELNAISCTAMHGWASQGSPR